MAGAEQILDRAVVFRPGILVGDQKADRRAGGQALEDPGEDLHPVGLAPLGGVPALPGTAAVKFALEVVLGEAQAGRHAINHAADRGPVAFAKGRDAKQRPEGVARHGLLFRAYFFVMKLSSMSRTAGAASTASMPMALKPPSTW